MLQSSKRRVARHCLLFLFYVLREPYRAPRQQAAGGLRLEVVFVFCLGGLGPPEGQTPFLCGIFFLKGGSRAQRGERRFCFCFLFGGPRASRGAGGRFVFVFCLGGPGPPGGRVGVHSPRDQFWTATPGEWRRRPRSMFRRGRPDLDLPRSDRAPRS